MIEAVRVVGVCVSDQQKALAFYTQKLGFDVIRDDPMGPDARWIEVAPPGAQTHVVLFTPPGLENRIGTFANVVFLAKDIQATYQELKRRGVQFTEPPTRQPWGGTQALFVDQDGNGFVLVDA
jgi:predicted enzyme related to lactoylglutathione lyase